MTPLPEPTQAPDLDGCHRCGLATCREPEIPEGTMLTHWKLCSLVIQAHNWPGGIKVNGLLTQSRCNCGAEEKWLAAARIERKRDCESRPEIDWRALHFASTTDAAIRYLAPRGFDEPSAREIIEQVRAGEVEEETVRAILGMGR